MRCERCGLGSGDRWARRRPLMMTMMIMVRPILRPPLPAGALLLALPLLLLLLTLAVILLEAAAAASTRFHRGWRDWIERAAHIHQRQPDVFYVHRLGTAFKQRRVQITVKSLVNVGDISCILDAEALKCHVEAFTVARLDCLKPCVHVQCFGLGSAARRPSVRDGRSIGHRTREGHCLNLRHLVGGGRGKGFHRIG